MADTCTNLQDKPVDFFKEVANVMQGIAKGAKAILTTLMEGMEWVASQAEKISQAVIDLTVGAIEEAKQKILNYVNDKNGPIQQIKKSINDVSNFVGDIIKSITDIACGIASAISEAINEVLKTISSIINDILKGIKKVFEVIERIIKAIKKIIEEIIRAVEAIINELFGAVGDFIDGVMNEIDGIFKNLFKPVDCGLALANKLASVAELENLVSQYQDNPDSMTQEEFTEKLQAIQEKIEAESQSNPG